MPTYEVWFDYRQFKADLKIEIPALPQLFKDYFGAKLTKGGAYAWFERNRMPVERLIQLFAVVGFENQVKLDFWKYVHIAKKEGGKTKRAA